MKIRIALVLSFLISWLSGFAFTSYPYWEQRQSQFDVLPVDSTDIIFLGNSLTDGGKWTEMFDMPNVKNRGIVSDIIEGVSQRTKCITSGKPAKIFLLIGVNDVSHHLSADSIATAVEALVKKLQAETPTTQIFLQSYLPINNDFGIYKSLTNESETILKCNVLLEQVAERTGVTWINLFPGLMNRDCKLRPELTADGLHLTEAGYCIWRDKVAPYVAPGKKFTDALYPVPEGTILVLGNSLVRHGEWQELLQNGKVKSRGSWHDRAKDLLPLAEIMALYHPAQVLIQPSYDKKDDKANVVGDLNPDSIVAYTEKCILAFRNKSPETVIYLESLVPVNPSYEKYASFAGKGKAIKSVNNKLRKLAKKYKIQFIDITTPLSDNEGNLRPEFTNDGFSLMGLGYKAWADAVMPYLK